ncbi:2-phospho-L-lactate transferase [Pseudonocardia asaccharolytica]|uniref:LPPG--FO 2-phospho-L-lactate transferase n=1 Tax=Pseudonocardia asaccharolytica DSM 44247 = NBRC 16224 TaxID=1123024 RepID=A0A511D3E6_9PSEU|nr:2-phospho-L-lactate transferase [Pseudonocardia asaccharolytica]GEL18114.1 LPPG--FO 2-phospho-L-lactate transferase [Pseudonocardia asaccharolytica DSM 44247 = NBRC 16224]
MLKDTRVRRSRRIVGLGGGIGASRLWRALVALVPPTDLTLVVNTADDLWMHGLRICPDLDTTLYALADRQDTQRGWGLRDESFRCMEALRDLGHDVWFNLGDRDLATHLFRTGLLRTGVALTEVTQRLAAGMGVAVRVLPMTEAEVATRVTTVDGRGLHYEEFLVREHAAPAVADVDYAVSGEPVTPAPGVLDALRAADLVVIAPSNPVASIAPILAVPGIRDAVAEAQDVVAVTPIVSGVPITDPGEQRRAVARAALLAAAGVPATASGVATLYAKLCARYVLDVADSAEAAAVASLGLEPLLVPTLLHQGACARDLVATVLGRSA